MMKSTYFSDDTIIAIATPAHSFSAIGVIRLSGKNAITVSKKIVLPHKISMDIADNHKMYRCYFLDKKKEIIDDGMFVLMKAPNSYTGENCVEFHVHGNPYLLNRIVALAIETGKVRKALPGEFSFRSFQNGKLDLSQAEAVSDLISSESFQTIKSSANILAGGLKNTLSYIKEKLMYALAQVELDIDFSDQGVSAIQYEDLARDLKKWIKKVSTICDYFQETIPLREGLSVVFIGAPNSGKSTLFNRILGENRSIVSKMKGTTRDVVKESISFGQTLLLLSDTAGIRKNPELVEEEGIKRSYEELKRASIILFLVGIKENRQKGDDFWDKEELSFVEKTLRELYDVNREGQCFLLLNKIDSLTPKEVNHVKESFLSSICIKKEESIPYHIVPISAKEGFGMEILKEKILGSLHFKYSIPEDGTEITRKRHYHLLKEASVRVKAAIQMIEKKEYSPDILAQELRMALDFVGEITGEVSSEDLLHHIFSKFCIGK